MMSLTSPPYVDLQEPEVISHILKLLTDHAVCFVITLVYLRTTVDQISQSPRGIFINQSKYALESLKKYGYESCDPVDTPMPVDLTYKLLYALCARIRLGLPEKLLNAVKGSLGIKRIPYIGSLWYPSSPEGFSFAITAFADGIMLVVKYTRRSNLASIQL
ncbi:hypothetical protein Tco_0428650 [Tanacetum coccineum]